MWGDMEKLKERWSMNTRAERVRSAGVLVLLLFGVLFFASLSVKEYLPYIGNRIKMERLQGDVAGRDDKGRRKIDWEKLHEVNEDIIAWIEIPGTKVDYPVLRCPSYSYYLHHDVEGKNSILGSIFVQPETAGDFSDIHTVIYGHNMNDRQMFGSLHSFESKEFWKKHRKVYIYLPEQEIEALVYSIYDVADSTETYRTKFDTLDDWKEWIAMTVEKRYYDTGIQPGETKRIITLSTCSNRRGRKSRFVVNCVVESAEAF